MKNTRSFQVLACGSPLLAACWAAQRPAAGTISNLGAGATPTGSAQDIDWDESDKRRDERYQVDRGLDAVGVMPGMIVGEVGAG